MGTRLLSVCHAKGMLYFCTPTSDAVYEHAEFPKPLAIDRYFMQKGYFVSSRDRMRERQKYGNNEAELP